MIRVSAGHCWSRMQVSGKLPIPHCTFPSSIDGVVKHEVYEYTRGIYKQSANKLTTVAHFLYLDMAAS